MTIRQLCDLTGFSRDAITTRVRRWNLPDDFSAKDVLQLRPLDDGHARSLSLEEARTELAIEQTRIARQQADKNDGNLVEVDAILEKQNELLGGIAAIIKSSPIPDAQKEDIFDAIRDHGRNWGEGK